MISYICGFFLHLIEVNWNLKYLIIQGKKTIQAMQKNNVVLCFLNYIIEGQSNNLYQEKVYQNLGGSAQKKRIKKYD